MRCDECGQPTGRFSLDQLMALVEFGIKPECPHCKRDVLIENPTTMALSAIVERLERAETQIILLRGENEHLAEIIRRSES